MRRFPRPSHTNSIFGNGGNGCTGSSIIVFLLVMSMFVLPAAIMGDDFTATSFFIIFGIEIGVLFLIVKVLNSSGEPSKTSEEQNCDFDNLLKKFNVPTNHIKIVIERSSCYAIDDCPTIVWQGHDKISLLFLKSEPYIIEEEISNFCEIKFEVLLNHKNQNSDWNNQTYFIRNMFKPYINEYVVGKGFYENALYKVGNFVLYPYSVNGLLRTIDKPITDYKIYSSIDSKMENEERLKTIHRLFMQGAIDFQYYNELKNAVIEYVIKNSKEDKNNRLYSLLKSKVFSQNDIQKYLD